MTRDLGKIPSVHIEYTECCAAIWCHTVSCQCTCRIRANTIVRLRIMRTFSVWSRIYQGDSKVRRLCSKDFDSATSKKQHTIITILPQKDKNLISFISTCKLPKTHSAVWLDLGFWLLPNWTSGRWFKVRFGLSVLKSEDLPCAHIWQELSLDAATSRSHCLTRLKSFTD